MKRRNIPADWVQCEFCEKVGPVPRLFKHLTEDHGMPEDSAREILLVLEEKAFKNELM